MRKALSAIRWYVLNMGGYFLRNTPQTRQQEKIAYFDLERNVYHRYLLIFMEMLRGQGYTILLRHRFRSMARWDTSLLIGQFPFLKIVRHSPPKADLTFTDRPGTAGIQIAADYFSEGPGTQGTYFLPMPMSHGIYVNGLDKWVPDLDKIPSTRALFFAGNVDPKHYNSASLEHIFHVFNRCHLLSLIQRNFPDRVASPKSSEEFSGILPDQDILLIDRHAYNIPERELRTTIARHDLFLAAPGVVMPFCHNLTEAMSVGSIPVLQFAHLMAPPLEHGVNCFSFSNEEELAAILREFPHMGADKILRMRSNVLAYYTKYLSVDAIMSKLESGTVERLKVHAEANSVALVT